MADNGPTHAYLIGPMTGYEDLNREAFEQAMASLAAEGKIVHSPRHHEAADAQEMADREQERTPFQARQSKEYADGIKRNLTEIAQCTEAYVLPGWHESEGARLDILICQAAGLDIFLYDSGHRFPARFGVATKL